MTREVHRIVIARIDIEKGEVTVIVRVGPLVQQCRLTGTRLRYNQSQAFVQRLVERGPKGWPVDQAILAGSFPGGGHDYSVPVKSVPRTVAYWQGAGSTLDPMVIHPLRMMTRHNSGWIIWRGKDFTVGAATFEIVIKGTLSDPVAALIDGFRVSRIEHGETHLIGPMPDQAKLQGILTLFGNLNIEIVSVNPVPEA